MPNMTSNNSAIAKQNSLLIQLCALAVTLDWGETYVVQTADGCHKMTGQDRSRAGQINLRPKKRHVECFLFVTDRFTAPGIWVH
jgi:hypothetical protein